MATKTKQWPDGSSATIQYGGQGDGQIIITSDANEHYEARSMQITVETTDGSGIQRVVNINQAAKQRIDLSAAVVTAATQTYSGSAKTPIPTVTLNGSTVPSTGYDVSYSNNTNAGTATITVTGKGDYTGTAIGTFTINKATPTYTAPTARSLTYSGSAQYLTTTGSTSHGTIQYSNDGTNWYTTRRQGTNAGGYTTYWRLVGDSNHTDVSVTSISTTIAKASRTISWLSYPSSLNIGGSGTLSASVSAGSGDGTISYSSSSSSKASVSGSAITGLANGTATITASVSEGTNYKSASTSYTISITNIVDLGLPSGRLWAHGNIKKSGSSYIIGSPTDYGCYFSWGNVVGHNENENYDWGTAVSGPYASTAGGSVSSDISSSDASHDAAYACLGGSWHMPTLSDVQEIWNNTDHEWTTINGINGEKLMKKTNHNIYVFIPASGNGYGTLIFNKGNQAYLWTSKYYSASISYSTQYPTAFGHGEERYRGLAIRAVK